MPSETTTQHGERQSEEVVARLDRLESMIHQLAAGLDPRLVYYRALTPTGHPLFHGHLLRALFEEAILLSEVERERFEAAEWPVEPWRHLVGRRYGWRKQLYIKGRNMTARQLVGTVKANRLTPDEAASDLD